MTKFYRIEVTRDRRLAAYDRRLKASRQLASLINLHGLNFKTRPPAIEAAKDISKNPLVEKAVLTRVEVTKSGTYRNGRRYPS